MYGTATCLSHSKRPQFGDDYFVYDLSVFVLDTPGNTSPLLVWEIYQASGSLPGPWAVLPLRGSHRAVSRRKSHYAVKDLRLCAGSCPALTGQLPLLPFGCLRVGC